MSGIFPKLKHTFMNLMESLPTVCLTQFLQYGIMLHCCKRKIRNSDFRYYQEKGLSRRRMTVLKKLTEQAGDWITSLNKTS